MGGQNVVVTETPRRGRGSVYLLEDIQARGFIKSPLLR